MRVESHVGLHVKFPLRFPEFYKNYNIYHQISVEFPDIKFHGSHFSESRVLHAEVWTDIHRHDQINRHILELYIYKAPKLDP
jgi:hypothetical protein